MSYGSISKCMGDMAFTSRVNACINQERLTKTPISAEQSSGLVWAVACANDVEAAYESALAASNPDPGGDSSVITDGMILAHVQASWPPPVTP